MLSYILRRCLYMLPTLFLISILAFMVIQAPPGDFLTSELQNLQRQYGSAAEERITALRQRYGLDRPIYVQYFKWIYGIILRGDFGISFLQNRPVLEIVIERIPVTIMITLITLIFSWIVALPIGVYSAVKQNTIIDYFFTFVAFIGQSIPNFMLALILMYFFYTTFNWSLGGLFSSEFQRASWDFAKLMDFLRHLLLPIIVVGTAGTAGMVRVLRGTMLDELGKDYIQSARSKGLTERTVIWKHAFKVAVLPIVSTIGWVLPVLVSGTIITSIVLNLPTTGAMMFNALQSQDMYVAGAFVLLLSTLTLIGTLISDILLVNIDPRIRYE